MKLILITWGTPGGIADVYPSPCGDGNVTVNDELVILNAWGSCSSLMESESMSVENAVAMLLDQLAEHPEWEDAIGESISYILENGL